MSLAEEQGLQNDATNKVVAGFPGILCRCAVSKSAVSASANISHLTAPSSCSMRQPVDMRPHNQICSTWCALCPHYVIISKSHTVIFVCRRMKAAYAAYLDAEMPRVKLDKPGLKLSQYKDMIWKSWQKSPSNPLHQQA